MKEQKYTKFYKEGEGPPAQLLARCRGDDVKVSDCCKDNKKDHELYQKKGAKSEGLQFVCCYKDLGTWMPTDKDPGNKFCSVTAQENQALRGARSTFDIARQLQHLLKRLQSDKREYRRAFKEAYMAHEQVENSKRGELQLQLNQIKYTDEEADRKKARAEEVEIALNSAQASLADQNSKFEAMQTANRQAQEKYETEAAKLTETIKLSTKKFHEFLDSIGKCASAKAEAKANLEVVQAALDSIETQQQTIQKQSDVLKTQRKEKEDALKKQKEEFAKKRQGIDKLMKDMKQQYNTYMDEIKTSKAETAKAEQKLEKLIEEYKEIDDASLIQVGDKYKYLKETAPVNVEEDFYAEAGSNGSDGKALTARGQIELLNEAKAHMTKEVDNTNLVLKKLKSMNARILKLKELDVDLNRKILADIESKSSKLGEALKSAQTKLAALVQKIEANTQAIQDLNDQERQMEISYEEAQNKERETATRRSENLEKLSKELGDMSIKCKSLEDQFKDCKKELQTAVKAVNVANQQKAKAEDETTAMEKRRDEAKLSLEQAESDVNANQLANQEKMSTLKEEYMDLNVKVNEASEGATVAADEATAMKSKASGQQEKNNNKKADNLFGR
jgi:chromosome segregation ATPase